MNSTATGGVIAEFRLPWARRRGQAARRRNAENPRNGRRGVRVPHRQQTPRRGPLRGIPFSLLQQWTLVSIAYQRAHKKRAVTSATLTRGLLGSFNWKEKPLLLGWRVWSLFSKRHDDAVWCSRPSRDVVIGKLRSRLHCPGVVIDRGGRRNKGSNRMPVKSLCRMEMKWILG